MRKRQTLKRQTRRPARKRAPLPCLWLISDARNDPMLESALARLPRGSGFVFRHYHLPPAERRARWRHLARIARRHGHRLLWAGAAAEARRAGCGALAARAERLAAAPAAR